MIDWVLEHGMVKRLGYEIAELSPFKNQCQKCVEEPFSQCKDNPCNYRKQISTTACLKNSTPKTSCHQSNNTKIEKLINLDKPKVNRLLGKGGNLILNSLLRYTNVNRLAIDNIPLLLWACRKGHYILVELLLINGADKNNETVLKNAVYGGCTRVIDVLIEYGCSFKELKEDVKEHYLNMAIIQNNPKMIQYLLHWGLEPNLSSCHTMDADGLELLFSHGLVMERSTKGKMTIANYIIKSLYYGLDPENKISVRRLNGLKTLFTYANVKRCENHEYSITGRSLLHQSIEERDTICLEYLLMLGLDPDSRESSTGKTPLHIAAKILTGHTIKLLTYGSGVEAIDYYGNTALHEAVKECNHHNVRDLLFFGSQPHARNYEGQTAIHIALDHDDDTSIELMLLFDAEDDEIDRLLSTGSRHQVIREVLTRHVIKKKSAKGNQDVNLMMDEKWKIYGEDCKNELDKMKTLMIPGSEINCLDLLHSNRRKLVNVASVWSINKMTKFFDNRIHGNFPIYENWLWKKMNLGVVYGPVYNLAVESLYKIFDFKLPILVIDRIMLYLNFADMNNVNKISQQLDNNLM